MAFSVSSAQQELRDLLESQKFSVLPSPSALSTATEAIVTSLPATGRGPAATTAHLLKDITPGFQGQKTTHHYYGFVTGGTLPIAEVADNVVTAFDQSLAVHLPDQSLGTFVEDAASSMLVELLGLNSVKWEARVFTTGATGSNVLGLACGRE